MRYIIFFVLTFILMIPLNLFAGGPEVQSDVNYLTTDRPRDEVYSYYDLRNRKTYIQLTNVDTESPNALPALCVHIQVFQQDQNCDELNFEDQLTPNDTVIYDLDNLIRNDGSEVPVSLDDDSYGFVAISAFICNDRTSDDFSSPLLGNSRIIDDAGYEYRMNLVGNLPRNFLELSDGTPPPNPALGNFIIPFNTVDGAINADVVGFIVEDDRTISGSDDGSPQDLVYNEEVGITFDIFQFDENEEPISCDQKTFGCGPNVVLNYGINDDYPPSRGDNLLCEGAGLNPNQTNGFISLENASFLSPLDEVVNSPGDSFEFICLVGLNNGNNTGSMDECRFSCSDPPCPVDT